MPLYEYTCGDCDRPFELLVSSPALADTVVCRHCGSASVRRLVSSFAAHSKGESALSSALAGRSSGGGGGGCCGGGGGCACGH